MSRDLTLNWSVLETMLLLQYLRAPEIKNLAILTTCKRPLSPVKNDQIDIFKTPFLGKLRYVHLYHICIIQSKFKKAKHSYLAASYRFFPWLPTVEIPKFLTSHSMMWKCISIRLYLVILTGYTDPELWYGLKPVNWIFAGNRATKSGW